MSDIATLARALADTHAAAFPATQVWSDRDFAGLLTAPGVTLTGGPESFILSRQVLDEAEILTLATAPVRQRQGVADRLLGQLLQDLVGQGIHSVFLEVAENNHPARNLYEKHGFRQTGRRRDYYRMPDGSRAAALVLARVLAA